MTLGALLGAAPLVFADEASDDPAGQQTPAQVRAPDNTGNNRRTDEPTADQQPNDRSDLEITRRIRRALVRDKHLSLYGHNVKIVAQNGAVTLKGPVRSAAEKELVERTAAEVAGAANVNSQLAIAPKK